MLRELLAEALAGSNGEGVVPQVPAPPVAAVLRPSTWTAPPAGAEVIGGGGVPDADAQHVPMASDEDLDRSPERSLARPPGETGGDPRRPPPVHARRFRRGRRPEG